MTALATIPQEDGPLVALDLEQQVLGGLLANNKVFERVQAFLQPEHFADARHAEIFECIKAMLESGKPATPPMLSGYMGATDSLAKIGGNAYLARIVAGTVSVALTEDYARALLDLWARRQAVRVIDDARDRLKRADLSDPAAAQLAQAASALDELAVHGTTAQSVSIGSAATDVVNAVAEIVEDGVVPELVPTGFRDLDRIIGGLEPGEMMILGARPSQGKAQPLDAKILMADGSFKTMGDLRPGDALASIDGASSRVAGIYPQGEREVFRVTFSDGRSTLACGEHLWRVGNRKWDEDQVLSTRALIALLQKPSFQNRAYIPVVSGHFGHDEALPIDPWLLGALIANGSLARGTPQFSTGDATTLWAVQEKVAAAGGTITRSPGNHYDFRIKATGDRNEITHALDAMGLMGKRSHEKSIPPRYLTANRQARVELLRGLMDTDGYVEKDGSVKYSSSSLQLALDVQDLVRSLGGNCQIATKHPHYTYLGERKPGRPHFICSVRFKNPREFITLLRKQRRAPEVNDVRLNITSIESVGTAPVQCIAVTHSSRLYVTDDYVVTHNTAAAQWISYNAASAGYPVAFFSLEMQSMALTRRWVSGLSRVSAIAMKTGEVWERRYGQQTKRRLSADEMARIRQAAASIDKLPLHIDARPALTTAEIVAGVRKLNREKKNIQLVVIDYLGLARSNDKARSEYEMITAISRELKAAAKTLNLPFIVLSQLSRANESRDDKRPQLSDLRSSGAIEQDGDIIAFLHREHYYLARAIPKQGSTENEGEFRMREAEWQDQCRKFKGRAEIIIAKSRNGAVDTIEIAFEDEITRFRDLEETRDDGGEE